MIDEPGGGMTSPNRNHEAFGSLADLELPVPDLLGW